MAADAKLEDSLENSVESKDSKDLEAQLSARYSAVAKLTPAKQKLLYFAVAFLTFLATEATVTFGYYRHKYNYVLPLCIGLFGLAVYLWWFQARGPYYLPLAISVGFGVSVGLLLGLYNYDVNYVFVEFYENSQSYSDVSVASTSLADAYRDGGRLTFTADSFVDATRSVGWKASNGNTYCIAPIVPSSAPDQVKVEFWAVGVNCCSSVGHFFCDDSEKLDVHSGAVVFDSHGWFVHSNFDYYALARKKAVGEFSLTSANVADTSASPTYVRWHADTGAVQKAYRSSTYLFTGVTGLIIGGFCLILGNIVTKHIGLVAMQVKGSPMRSRGR